MYNWKENTLRIAAKKKHTHTHRSNIKRIIYELNKG